jgi:hypothetical protein
MKRAGIMLFSVLLIESLWAYAGDCSISKKFRLNTPQVLSGVLLDPAGAVLQGVAIELRSGKTTFRRLKIDEAGRYDFGEVPAGEYRVRAEHGDHDFCAPKVKCGKEGCVLEPRLEINPKNTVTVY